MNKIVAITGGIGSGKTTALKIIQSMGYTVLSCDEIVNSLYKKQSVLRKLKKPFPSAVKGKIFYKVDKSELSRLCFISEENRKTLENFVHPKVIEYAKEKLKNKPLSFLEIPLLFESGLENEFYKVLIVKRNLTDRIESVKIRSNLTEQEILARIKAQVDYDKIDYSKYLVLENNENVVKLKEKIAEIIKNI